MSIMKKHLALLLAIILCISLIQPVLALNETEDNNNLENAQVFALNETMEASIEIKGDADFYSLTLPESGLLELDMTAYMRYNNVYFYDANGKELWKKTSNEWDSAIGYQHGVYKYDLLAGTYYVKISSNSSTTGNYTLKNTFTPANSNELEPNNSTSEAQTIRFDEAVEGHIAFNDPYDVFSFVLPEAGLLTLDLTARMRYNCIYLYDESGNELWKDTENEWNSSVGYRNDVYTINLLPGTYYVKINGYRYGTSNLSTGTYTFQTSFKSAKSTETEPNNSIAEAMKIEFAAPVEGHIGINDRYDFYAVTLPESGLLTLNLTARMRYNCIYLYDADGKELWSKTGNEWNSSVGYRSDSYSIDLLPATYYVKITGYRYNTSDPSTGTYTFDAAFTPAKATELEPNNSIAEAEALAFATEVKGHISMLDRYDFFALDLPQSGRLKLELTAYMRYNCIYLYDESGALVWSDTWNEWNSGIGYHNDSYSIDLLGGKYFVKISGYRYETSDASTGTYTFKADFDPANATETEPNNSVAEATPLLAGAATGHIAINDRFDFYSFTLSETTDVELSITFYMRFCAAYIYDANGKQLWEAERKEWDSSIGSRSDTYTVNLEPGTYYLKITGYRYDNYDGSTGTYEFSMGHQHSYTAEVIAPNCTQQGCTEYKCLCGKTYKEDILPALGHSFGDWAAVEEGKEERTCSVCGEREEREVEIAHKHNYVATVIAPGCTTRGCTEYKCECGESYEDLYVNPKGHSFGQWQEATQQGKEERVCSACGEREERDSEVHQHRYSYEITKPTCTEGGYTTYTCLCGDSYEDDFVDAIGHDEKVNVIKAASCEEPGEAEYECVRCGAKRTGVLPTLDHEFHGDSCTYCGNPAAYEERVNINYRRIKIVLDGKEIIPCDGAGKTVEPFIMSSSGTTYLPLRAVSQALGLNVQWDGVANTVTLKSGGTVKTGAGPAGKSIGEKTTYITYRNIRVFLDGTQLRLVNSLGVAVEPFILNSNSSVYLPLRIIGEALGLSVGWDGSTSTVYLNTNSGK